MSSDMELQDFIRQTLVQIAIGVRKANSELHKDHGGEYSNAPFRLHSNLGDRKSLPGVSFDVAVTAATGTTGKAGARISVAQVFGIGGETQASANDTCVHRIKFVVGLHQDWD